MTCKKGDWVQIHQIILKQEERAPQVPEDTKLVPFELWVKGFALHDAEIGQEISIETITKRKMNGTLCAVNPGYNHDFGACVPELLKIDKQVKEILWGGENDESR